MKIELALLNRYNKTKPSRIYKRGWLKTIVLIENQDYDDKLHS